MSEKIAIVTGGGKGIGKAVCLALAEAGHHVVINYAKSKDDATATAQACEALGVKTLLVQADVANFDDCQRLVAETLSTFGRIDVLVNNAGITKDMLLMKMTPDAFNAVIDVNLKGTFHMMQSVSRTMLKQRSGSIINMASVVGLMGNAGQANYCASKAGVIGMTKSFAREAGSRNIRVNAVAPGFIATDMTENLPETVKATMSAQIPMNRFGSPDDVAKVVRFLASEEAAYITGQVISVDGGMHM